MKNIGLRIKIKRKLRGLTQEALGRVVGVSKVAVSRWESGKNAINSELLDIVARSLGVNPEWLLTGESFATKEDEHAQVFWAPSYKNVKPSTGIGTHTGTGDCLGELTPIPRKILKYQENHEKIFCTCIRGDSMEPVLGDGSIVAFNRADTSIREGKMYLIKQEELLRVKLVYLFPAEIVLKSYNPSYKDEVYKLKGNNIQILGRVFWYSSGLMY